jgi:membrane protease YdiL (CAAX protease family)
VFPEERHQPKRRFSPLVYFEESRRPLVVLVFILPILIAYELGVRITNVGREAHVVNAADAVIKMALDRFEFYGPLLSAVCIVLTLVLLHMHRNLPWRVRPATLVLMIPESLVLALPIFPLQTLAEYALLAGGTDSSMGIFEKLVLSLGAGVYEEFLFRLLLVGGLILIGRKALARFSGERSGRPSGLTALEVGVVLVSSLLFAGLHYLGPHGVPFTMETLSNYAFFTLAGIYFSWVYLVRGFGIAVGAHTAYDLMVVTLMAIG